MKWQQQDAYHLSTDGYTVCKVKVDGKTHYEAWKDKACLGSRIPTANEAIAVCERDAK